MSPLGIMLLVAAMLAAKSSTPLPWVFPGDFRERLRMSDLVVAGTIEDTRKAGSRTVDGVNVTANGARLRADRVFEGSVRERELRFTWFALRFNTTGEGYAYSGPPLAGFRPGHRYLVFLRRALSGWEVAMPVYAIEVELADRNRKSRPWSNKLLRTLAVRVTSSTAPPLREVRFLRSGVRGKHHGRYREGALQLHGGGRRGPQGRSGHNSGVLYGTA